VRRTRFLLALLLALLLFMGWTSSPTVSLALTRQQAVARAAVDATVHGQVAWSRVESKLVTYREWNGMLIPRVPGFGASDVPNPDALYWVVAYLGPLTPVSADYCEWVIRVFAADERAPSPDYGASTCGRGGWQWSFSVLPDHSWFRPDALRGE
jgi:hypothetical protein